MEQISKRKKIIHPLYIIQYNDKAIADLKWNRKTEARQRVKVNFKNGEIIFYILVEYFSVNDLTFY